MATDVQVAESFPPRGWHSDALKFYEVVDGRFVENPPMGAKESVLAALLQELMGPFARANRLGRVVPETLFLIDRARKLKRRPDLAFISAQRWPLRRRVPRTEAWDVVPDLAVEVVSQSNTADAVAIKIEEYFQAGVRVVWVIYPVNNKVYVYNSPTSVRILQVGDTLEGGELLPGFQIALSILFDDGDEEPEPTD
ncbi:MAG TPA: Uma2 family endonuclease [Isosphaeraceae bacterium]|nr:Uma2 family endonuclease [Isosphaeraceae bacterium]